MTERIVVATDGGEASAAAIRWVNERSKHADVAVEVTTVAESDAAVDACERVLAGQAATVAGAGAGAGTVAGTGADRVTSRLRRGSPAKALIAASRGADLLVVGTNRTGAMAGIVHGTLPLRVAGRAECPVVVVPAAWNPAGAAVVAAWDSDGTGDVVLEFAAAEAERLGAPLTVVHAWSLPPVLGAEMGATSQIADELAAAAREQLDGALKGVRSAYPQLTVVERLEFGPPAIAIVTAARDAALVVVGSHGRGALGGLVLGSVSHDVLMNMPAPVAVIPADAEPIEVLPEILDEDLI